MKLTTSKKRRHQQQVDASDEQKPQEVQAEGAAQGANLRLADEQEASPNGSSRKIEDEEMEPRIKLRAQDSNERGADKQAANTKQRSRESADESQHQAKCLVKNLISAASEGKLELCRLLLRCGADINGQDEEVSLS